MSAGEARLGIGVIGAGRVGPVLANALRALGHAVVGVTSTSERSQERVEALLPGVPVLDADEVVRRAEVVLLTVPDDSIAPVVEGLAALGCWQVGQLVIHTSGAHALDVLEPARAAGAIPLAIHPAMTFTGTSVDVARLAGCPFGVTAPAPVLPIAQALVVELGGEPFVVPPADRAAYHAALTHGANHLVTLVAQARRILTATGIEDPGRLLGPLLGAALDGVLDDGEARLTGPVVRGDVGTVRHHLEALDELGLPDVTATYRHLAATTALRAAENGRIPDAVAAELVELAHEDLPRPGGPLDGPATGAAEPKECP
ncbi:MAG TPA: DUF2520 domain-containing protein [Actinomycetales bacterium]|nr:DUF2520 domain-containing protein [Actinomycetales bacterium]